MSVEELTLTEAEWRDEVMALGVPESRLIVAEAATKPLCAYKDVDELAIVLHSSLNATDPDLAALPDQAYGLGVRYLCPSAAQTVADAIDLLEALRTGDDPLCSLTLDEAWATEPESRQLLWSNVCA